VEESFQKRRVGLQPIAYEATNGDEDTAPPGLHEEQPARRWRPNDLARRHRREKQTGPAGLGRCGHRLPTPQRSIGNALLADLLEQHFGLALPIAALASPRFLSHLLHVRLLLGAFLQPVQPRSPRLHDIAVNPSASTTRKPCSFVSNSEEIGI
jgi:hypothetical protein